VLFDDGFVAAKARYLALNPLRLFQYEAGGDRGVCSSRKPRVEGIEEERAMDRDKLIAGMLTDVSPPLSTDQVAMIKAALKAFSDKQLTAMDDAGVRMWPFVKGLPPDIAQLSIKDLGAPAEYVYQTRVVRISPASLAKSSAVNDLRHEFAHAWDNVRSGKNLKSLRKLKPDAQIDEINARAAETAPFGSDSLAKLPPAKQSMQDMADDYKKILEVDRDKFSFAHDSTAPKHAAADVREFYAEGYSVFHGFSVDKQARMYWIARHFFDHLDQESKGLRLASPNRKSLEQTLDGIDKNWRSF
jgi:hypothetical protein